MWTSRSSTACRMRRNPDLRAFYTNWRVFVGSVLHGGSDPVTEVGEGATVGHLCIVHGAVIGEEALVGNGATVLDGVIVGRRALVAAGATVPPGMAIPDGMLAAGVPARVVGEVTAGGRQWVEINPGR